MTASAVLWGVWILEGWTDGESTGWCVGEAGTLTVQAATCAPDLPVLLIASRLTAGCIAGQANSDDSSSEDGDGDERMHGAAGEGDAVQMAVVDGCAPLRAHTTSLHRSPQRRPVQYQGCTDARLGNSAC